MKIVEMNKNVSHNGKDYAKGEKIKDSNLAEMLVKMGHANVIEINKEDAVEVAVSAPVVEAKSEEQSEKPKQPVRKSKR